VSTGVAAGSEADALETALRQAEAGGHGWVTTPFMLDLALRKA
jgi:hypothetical protein